MPAQKGSLFILKIGAADVLTARSTEMTINSETVDITNKSSSGWRTLLEGAAPRSMSISLEGVFQDETYEETIRGHAQAGTAATYTISSGTAGAGGTWTGSFIITSYSRSGTYNGEEVYSITLESAGVITPA